MKGERTTEPVGSDRSPAAQAGLTLSERESAVILALREVAFGEVIVIVHNARIVQITRSQKLRFPDG